VFRFLHGFFPLRGGVSLFFFCALFFGIALVSFACRAFLSVEGGGWQQDFPWNFFFYFNPPLLLCL